MLQFFLLLHLHAISYCRIFSMYFVQDIAEHLTTIYLKRCERGKRCLYEGSTPSGGFPNSWVFIIFFFFLFTLPLLFHMCHPKLVWAVETIWFLYAVINSIELQSCYA